MSNQNGLTAVRAAAQFAVGLVAQAVCASEDENPTDRFAGVRVDSDSRAVTVYLTEGTDLATGIAALAERHAVRVLTRPARYTKRELESLRDAVVAEREAPSLGIMRASIPVDGSGITFGIAGDQAGARRLIASKNTKHITVTVEAVGPTDLLGQEGSSPFLRGEH